MKRYNSFDSPIIYLFSITMNIMHLISTSISILLIIELPNIRESCLKFLNYYTLAAISVCVLMNIIYAILGFLISRMQNNPIRLLYSIEYIKIPFNISIYFIFLNFFSGIAFMMASGVDDLWIVGIVLFVCTIFILITPLKIGYCKAQKFVEEKHANIF